LKFNKYGKGLWTIVAYSPMIFALILKFCLTFFTNFIDWICFIPVLSLPLQICIEKLDESIRIVERTNPRVIKCKINDFSNSQYALFVVTYLIPFSSITFKISNFVPLIFLLLFTMYLYSKSPLFSINPILNLLNYNLYTGIYNNENIIIISKKSLKMGDNNLKLSKLENTIYLNVTQKEEE